MIKNFLIFITIFLTVCIDTVSAGSESVSLTFKIASTDRIDQKWHYQNDNKKIPIRLSSHSFSKMYHYRGSPKMNIYLSTASEEEDSIEPIICSAQFPKGSNGGLYLLLVDVIENEKMGYSIKIWEKNQIFPKDNQIMVINQLHDPIRFLAGSTVIDIMPKKSVTNTPSPIKKDRFHAQLFALREGKPYKAYEAHLRLGTSKSLLALVRTHPQRSDRVLLKTITYRNDLHPINLIKPPPAELKKYVDRTTQAEEDDEK